MKMKHENVSKPVATSIRPKMNSQLPQIDLIQL